MANRVDVIDGPNLNLLGIREPELYGKTTRAEIEADLRRAAQKLELSLTFYQSNHEGQLIDRLQSARANGSHGVLLNPAGFGHTSIALADAVAAIRPIPVVEVHLTNTAAREAARQASPVGAVCAARVEGFGADSYQVALAGLARILARE